LLWLSCQLPCLTSLSARLRTPHWRLSRRLSPASGKHLDELSAISFSPNPQIGQLKKKGDLLRRLFHDDFSFGVLVVDSYLLYTQLLLTLVVARRTPHNALSNIRRMARPVTDQEDVANSFCHAFYGTYYGRFKHDACLCLKHIYCSRSKSHAWEYKHTGLHVVQRLLLRQHNPFPAKQDCDSASRRGQARPLDTIVYCKLQPPPCRCAGTTHNKESPSCGGSLFTKKPEPQTPPSHWAATLPKGNTASAQEPAL
jgi:hypothetical protein